MEEDIQPIRFKGVDAKRPVVVAGPCSAETEEQVLKTAQKLAQAGIRLFRAGIWKPRTKPGGFEGVGTRGLVWLQRVKKETGMLVATEVATRQHVEEALGAGIDILWIGARTSANPFAVQEIADTLKGIDVPVLVKNPVNPDLELWIGAMQRLYNAGIRQLGAIHRGFSAYGGHLYRNMPQWRIPFELRRRMPSLTMFCDPSHIGGKRELVFPLSQQAMDMGFDGLIVEAHCTPERAWSDKDQQVTPEALVSMLKALVVREIQQPTEDLMLLRQQIDQIDADLLDALERRMRISREIGRYKKEHRMPVVQTSRYGDILTSRMESAEKLGLSGEFVKTVYQAIHEESVRQQIEVLNSEKVQAPKNEKA